MARDKLTDAKLLGLRGALDAKERDHLSDLAVFSDQAKRRRPEEYLGHRQEFATDSDRILHSRAYTRYIDKTQVFYMVNNDHITHRVLHVQLVSKIARTIGRFLGLNEDLIEAIALGHDIGHPPFGHDGEHQLDKLCREHGIGGFQHNIQSVEFLDRLERHGKGLNLSLQVLDGILCHDGEIHNNSLKPRRYKEFSNFEREKKEKGADPSYPLVPMSLEGCVVRFSDTIAYIGRDIEDAIELKLIERRDIPAECRDTLGNTNGKIVYTLVTDLIGSGIVNDEISFSPAISASLKELKKFNYERIYLNPLIKKGFDKIIQSYSVLFEVYLEHVISGRRKSAIFTEFLADMPPERLQKENPAVWVRDFLAGMTDDYFLSQAKFYGCEIPEKK